MTEVNFIGTGGSVATIERDNTSLLLHHNHNLMLIDIPGAAAQTIKKLNYDPGDVRTIIVTHIHPDHVYGLPAFVHGLMLKEMVLDLYGSAVAIDFCRQLLDLFHLLDEKIKCRVNFVSVEPGDERIVQDGVDLHAAGG